MSHASCSQAGTSSTCWQRYALGTLARSSRDISVEHHVQAAWRQGDLPHSLRLLKGDRQKAAIPSKAARLAARLAPWQASFAAAESALADGVHRACCFTSLFAPAHFKVCQAR